MIGVALHSFAPRGPRNKKVAPGKSRRRQADRPTSRFSARAKRRWLVAGSFVNVIVCPSFQPDDRRGKSNSALTTRAAEVRKFVGLAEGVALLTP